MLWDFFEISLNLYSEISHPRIGQRSGRRLMGIPAILEHHLGAFAKVFFLNSTLSGREATEVHGETRTSELSDDEILPKCII